MYKSKNIGLGKVYKINDGVSISEEFYKIAAEDERAAIVLYRNKNYNQSVYYYIQSMEKYIKCYIGKKVDLTNEYFADQLRKMGHSLNAAVDFLIEIISGNDSVLRQQVSRQLKHEVFKGINFSKVYNAARYPFYTNYGYSITKMSQKDCETMAEIYKTLKDYMNQIYMKL